MKNFFELFFYKSVNSTNDKLKELKSINDKKNIALFSKTQQKGRGRSSNTWFSQDGDLTCSFLINKELSFTELGKINIIIVNILISLFLKFNITKRVKYKWPNDILISERKISGILIETFSKDKVIESFVIGIGINVISNPILKTNKSISMTNLGIEVEPLTIFFYLIREIEIFFRKFDKLDFIELCACLNKKFL